MSAPSPYAALPNGGPASHIKQVQAPIGYRVLERIGVGAVGAVYRAEDLLLARHVALKVLVPGCARDPNLVEQFHKEARALARLRHGNVVQVYAFGEERGAEYIIMELVAGQTLDDLIEAHRSRGNIVPRERARRIIRGVAAGLSAVHDAKLVHRDLKPGNVMIEEETDRAVIIDFGLARRKFGSVGQMSIVDGTPLYMSPEQVRAEAVTAQSDIYALACVAFELLTGRCVFDGSSIFEIMKAHVAKLAPLPSSVSPELAPLDLVFERALQKNPADRFASVSDFIAAFDRAIDRVIVPESLRSGTRRSTLRMNQHEFVVLSAEPSVQRALVRAVRAVDSTAIIRLAGTVEAARDALGGGGVLVADESSAPSITSLIRAMDDRATAIVIATARYSPERAHALPRDFGAHILPKPVNVQVARAILKRVVSTTERREKRALG